MNQMVSPLALELHRAYKARQDSYRSVSRALDERVRRKLIAEAELAECLKSAEDARRKQYIWQTSDEMDEEFLRSKVAYPPIRRIISVVAREYGFSRMEIISQSKNVKIVFARQIAMYLSKATTKHSLPDLARPFGKRDHSTVWHAYHRISAMMEADEYFCAKVEELRAAVTGQVAG